MHKALSLEVWIVFIYLAKQLLDPHVLLLLCLSQKLGLISLEINLKHLIWDRKFARTCYNLLRVLLSIPTGFLLIKIIFCRIVEWTIMIVWNSRFSYELKYLLEHVQQILLFIVVQAQM